MGAGASARLSNISKPDFEKQYGVDPTNLVLWLSQFDSNTGSNTGFWGNLHPTDHAAKMISFDNCTETDVPGKVSVSANRIDLAAGDRDEDYYVSWDEGSATQGDYTHWVDCNVTSVINQGATPPGFAAHGVANTHDDFNDISAASGDAIVVWVARVTAATHYNINILNITGGSTTNKDASSAIAVGTASYLAIERVGTTCTVQIYSTPALRIAGGAGDVDTITGTVVDTAFQYVYGLGSINAGTAGRDITGWTANLIINPGVGTLDWDDFDYEMTGVHAPTVTTGTAGYRTLDGTNDYFTQKVYDTEQGVVTYNGNNLDDAGQDFTAFTTAAPGTAAYMVVVTDGDADVSWGYLGDLVDATEINVYTDKGLTVAGWNGDGGGGVPASYNIMKTDFQITGSMTVCSWILLDDGQPAAANMIMSKYLDAANAGWIFEVTTAGKLRFYTCDGVDITDYEESDDAQFTNGAETAFAHVAAVYTAGGGASVVLYKNGEAVASTTTGAIEAAITDNYLPLIIGGSVGAVSFAGDNAFNIIVNTGLSATQVAQIYRADAARFGL